MSNTLDKIIEKQVERYYKELEGVFDDTGYWDHDFVETFLRQAIRQAVEDYKLLSKKEK